LFLFVHKKKHLPYRLPEDHIAELPTFIMARRILVMAWMVSHAETSMARQSGAAYTAKTVELAEQLLVS